MVRRGEIFYIKPIESSVGYEQKERPAVIVSNNKCNLYSNRYEVVFLTTKSKTELPTHVKIQSTGKSSTALCECINTVDIERIGNYAGLCTESELNAIDNALRISLGLETTTVFTPPSNSCSESAAQITKAIIERDLYKHMYEELIGRITR